MEKDVSFNSFPLILFNVQHTFIFRSRLSIRLPIETREKKNNTQEVGTSEVDIKSKEKQRQRV